MLPVMADKPKVNEIPKVNVLGVGISALNLDTATATDFLSPPKRS